MTELRPKDEMGIGTRLRHLPDQPRGLPRCGEASPTSPVRTKRTRECGNEKITMPDGTIGDSCRQCHDIEERAPERRQGTGKTVQSGRRRDRGD